MTPHPVVWLLGWVLRSKTAYCLSSPTFFLFSITLFSLGVDGIGCIWVALPGKADYPFLSHFISTICFVLRSNVSLLTTCQSIVYSLYGGL